MKESESFSMIKRMRSFIFAFNGIRHMLRHEHNSKIHFTAMMIAIALGILFKIELAEWISLVVVSGLVFISELFNSAIEKLADKVDSEWNTTIGFIKDYAAGAVLVSAIVSIIVGGLIFVPALIEFFTVL